MARSEAKGPYVNAPASLLETLKDLLAASNPGLATKEDLARIEERIDELNELVDALAERLEKRTRPPSGSRSEPDAGA